MGTVDEDLTPPLPKGFTPAKKTDAVPPLPKGFTPSTDFTHGYKPTPEDIKTKQSYDDQQKSFETTPEQRKLSDQLNVAQQAYESHLTPQEHATLNQTQQAIQNRPKDTLRQPSKKEIDAQHAMNSTVGKITKSLEYVGSETSKGGLDILKGGAWVLNHMNTGLIDTQLIPDKAFAAADKITDLGVTPGQREQIESGKGVGWGSVRTLGMLGNIAPAAIGGEAAEIPKTMFALQGIGQGKNTMDAVDPDHKLNPAVRDLYVAGSGLVNGLIVGDLGENFLSKSVQDKIGSAIVSHAMQDAAEKGLTEDAVKTAAKDATKDFTNLVHTYAEKTGKAGIDLAALQAAQYVLKKGVDVASDEPVFNENLGKLMDNISDVVTKQAPLFGGVGAMLEGKEKDPNEVEKRDLGEQIQAKDAQISQLSEKTNDPVKNAENEVNLEQATKDREELNNKLKQLIVKQHETKNEGDAGHPAKTEESDATAQQTGKDDSAVHPEREYGQEGLTQSGEAGAEPVLKEKTDETATTKENGNAESKANSESDLPRQQRVGDTEGENEAKIERVKPTSIKKVITEATRQERELPDVELSKFKGDSPTLEHGKKLVGTGEVKPNEVIDRVTSGKGIYTPDEAAAMQYHMHQLRAADEDLRTQLADVDKKLESVPNDKQHKDARDLILGNIRQLDDWIEEATRANRINSRSWSNLGNTMQIEADHTFSPANIRGIIRDNYGGEIPKDVQARLDAAIKERDKALSDLKRATDNATTKQGKATVEKIRKSVGLVKMSKAELESEAETLKADLRKALKQDFSRVNSGIPIPTETLAVLGKLAVNYFKQGVKDFEGLVNRIHGDLKDTGVDKAQVREYLSNYEPLRDESKSRRVELLGRKERSINKQLETGKIRDYSRKPEITFKKDNEVVKAEQRVKDAEFKLKQEKAKSYNKTKSGTQRGLDWLIRWERRFVLSSPAILEKLASAVTIGGALRRAPEEVVGGMWTKMLPALMNKAPIEGGFNAKAEAAYWKDFSNPRKFLHNAREILKTGASDLTKEFSDKPHEHYQYYDALTDLHPIIKDISKRATYEASLIKGLNWAEGQGLDVSDPLIRQNIKQMAYNRAEYEIFQENSGWNRKLQKFLSDERTPKNTQEMLTRFATRFLMPVSTVPLNISRRIGNYATGLPRGLSNAIEAYKAGIENLTNEQAEIIAKQLKQGTMGAALFSMGLFGVGGSYGGFYNKDDRGGLDRTGVFDPGFDQMYFGKQKIDKPIQHALPLQLIQLGATMRNIHKLYMDKYATSDEYNSALEKQLKATSQAAMVSAAAIAEQVPMIEEPFELIGAFKDPYMRNKFAQGMKRRVTPTIVSDAEKLIKK